MNTHCFLETRVADKLGLPYDEYTEGDTEAAVVEHKHVQEYLSALRKIHNKNNDHEGLGPEVKNSCVAGISIVLTKYIMSDDFIDDLTDGRTKEGSHYMAIMNHGKADIRFDHGLFLKELKGFADKNNGVIDGTGGIIPAELPPEIVEKEEEAHTIPNEDDEFIENLCSTLRPKTGSEVCVIKVTEKGHSIIMTRASSHNMNKYLDSFVDIANGLNKHILVMNYTFPLSYIRKNVDRIKMMEKCIIIHVSPELYPEQFSKINNNCNMICLGHRIKQSYAPMVEVVDDSEDSYDKHGLSPYHKYGSIFKDAITGVLYALRDGFIVYSMVSLSDTNVDLFRTMAKELVRRWNGDISLADLKNIDIEHRNSVIKEDRDGYIDFCISNSNSYISKIKVSLETAIKDIGDLQKKLFEQVKMYSHYDEVINSFNEKEHAEKEKKKAIDAFGALENHPQINSIFVEEKMIHLYTADLNVVDTRTEKIHNLGTFHIQLGIHNTEYNPSESVLIRNTKYRVPAYNGMAEAPHIFNGGIMCHGNLIKIITDAYKDRDLYNVVESILVFLTSVNTSDPAGKYVNRWPIVEEKVDSEREKDKEFDDMLESNLNTPVVSRG